MESATTKSDAKDAMTDGEEPDRGAEPRKLPRPPAGDKRGYFHIYKKGQGYWTRMGTVGGVALMGVLTGAFLNSELQAQFSTAVVARYMNAHHLQQPRAAFLGVAVFAIAYSATAYHFLNKPVSVDFLIATDSEMKKVNWTTRKELVGSTKVVIGFMFVMAIMLLMYDLFFQMAFYLIGVLKTPPFFLGH